MRPRIVKHNHSWWVMIGDHMAGAWKSWDRAYTHARNIAEQPARQRAYRELERARLALERMETRRHGSW